MLRTDLAVENKEMYDSNNPGSKGEIPGVSMDVDDYEDDIKVVRIEVLNELGSKIMGKPEGNYITVEVPGILDGSEQQKTSAARAVATELKKMVPFHDRLKVLVIGLGNEKITPDSLGPHTVSKIRVTRHLFLLFDAETDTDQSCVSALNPGVMATTGMESAETIRSAVELVNPEVVIAIDALAARNLDRIHSTIQISDTGISPGAGTGNMRKQLTEQSLGRKVIAIGVPTVIDARTLLFDGLSELVGDKEAMDYVETSEMDMIVTSTEIDQVIHDFSQIIANAINITLHPGIYS